MLQPPQFDGSVEKSVQKAVAPAPHAFGRDAGQAHVLPTHCWPAAQAYPHVPQLFASLVVSAQYVGLDAGQALWPAEQVWTQLPAEQSWPSAQKAPAVPPAQVLEAPQCARSVAGSMQLPLQFTSPAAQVTTQAPCEQTFPGSQATPQAPQFLLSDASSVHESPQTVAEPSQSGFVLEHPDATNAAASSAIEMRFIVTPRK